MRREAATQREAAAAWRIERQSLLKLHASWADQAAAAARARVGGEPADGAARATLSQQRQLHDEGRHAWRRGRMRGLQAEVRSLENAGPSGRRAAAAAARLQQTLAMHGAPEVAPRRGPSRHRPWPTPTPRAVPLRRAWRGAARSRPRPQAAPVGRWRRLPTWSTSTLTLCCGGPTLRAETEVDGRVACVREVTPRKLARACDGGMWAEMCHARWPRSNNCADRRSGSVQDTRTTLARLAAAHAPRPKQAPGTGLQASAAPRSPGKSAPATSALPRMVLGCSRDRTTARD